MQRRILVFAILLAIVPGGLLPPLTAAPNDGSTGHARNIPAALRKIPAGAPRVIKAVSWGPTEDDAEAAKINILKSASVRAKLKGARHRILSFELVDKPKKANGEMSDPPDSFRATLFDYTNNRAFIASGRFDSATVEIVETQTQPDVSPEEFQEAVALLTKDSKIGPSLTNRSVAPYEPMPPLMNDSVMVKNAERTITVGLQAKDGSTNEIVAVNLIRQTVSRFADSAPPAASAVPTMLCGPPSAGQGGTGRGTGQALVTISRGDTEVWRFIVLRPSASSGTRASGVELRDVFYLGKKVLSRANAPILNVQYERNLCGPFRDWSYSEDSFDAVGTDLAPGVRLCTQPPQTILDDGTDLGNFKGVAVWDSREDVQLVSEMNAGWYRYLSEWNLQDDGVIRARYGFAATANSCVCHIHFHHVYWRLDFDIVGTDNQVSEDRNGSTRKLTAEETLPRIFGTRHRFIVRNSSGFEQAVIIPGEDDGNFDKYGRGDVWVLRNKFPSELDDGVNCTAGCDTRIRLDPFINAETVASTDLVVWYGGHWTHDNEETNSLSGHHVLGPNIVLEFY
jgi:hypothetical protein